MRSNCHSFYLLLFLSVPLPAFMSCSGSADDALRKETLRVYSQNSSEDINLLQIPPEGEPDGILYIETSEELSIRFEPSETEWLNASSISQTAQGKWEVHYSADRLSTSFKERYAVLTIVAPDKYFGRFVKMRQGYEVIWEENFSSIMGGEYVLNQDRPSYNTGYIDAGINKTYNIYLTFNAYAVRTEGQAFSFPLRLDILGGAVVDATWSESDSFEVPLGTESTEDNFFYVLINNKGQRISGNTRFEFTFPESGAEIHLDNVSVCVVGEDDRAYNPDEDPEEDEEL